jgi:hypothetical protein
VPVCAEYVADAMWPASSKTQRPAGAMNIRRTRAPSLGMIRMASGLSIRVPAHLIGR